MQTRVGWMSVAAASNQKVAALAPPPGVITARTEPQPHDFPGNPLYFPRFYLFLSPVPTNLPRTTSRPSLFVFYLFSARMCDFVPLPIICVQCGTYEVPNRSLHTIADRRKRPESLPLQNCGPYNRIRCHRGHGSAYSILFRLRTATDTYLSDCLLACQPVLLLLRE